MGQQENRNGGGMRGLGFKPRVEPVPHARGRGGYERMRPLAPGSRRQPSATALGPRAWARSAERSAVGSRPPAALAAASAALARHRAAVEGNARCHRSDALKGADVEDFFCHRRCPEQRSEQTTNTQGEIDASMRGKRDGVGRPSAHSFSTDAHTRAMSY